MKLSYLRHPPRSWACVAFAAIFCFVLFDLVASAQEWSDWQGPSGGVRIRAGLRDPAANGKYHAAAIEVEVENVWLNYPDAYAGSGIRIGVLQYEIDQCPKILTTDTRLRFQDLSPGTHLITISLLDLNQQLLAPEVKLTVVIP